MGDAPTKVSTVEGIKPNGWVLPTAVLQSEAVVVTASLPAPVELSPGVTASLQVGTIYGGQNVPQAWSNINPTTTTTNPTSNTSTSPATGASTTTGGSSLIFTGTHSLTSSTAPTEPSSTPSASTSNTAAIAGAAVGCLVGGLILGALGAYLLFGRRRKQAPIPVYAPVQYESQEKQRPTVVASGAHHRVEQLDKFLLDSKPDGDLASEVRSLNQLIQQHVENNYRLQPVHQDSNALAQVLVDLGIGGQQGSAMGPVHLTTLALDPGTRYAALRHIIAKAALNASSLYSTSPISLLPQSLGTFATDIPPVEAHRGSTQAVEVALTRWRQLSAFLLNPNRSERGSLVPTEDVSTQQAQHLTAALNRFVGAFTSRDREEAYEQENHLREVIVECAAFGYVLFSQPAEFHFHYQDGKKSQKYDGIVTFPGLDKIRDESGQRYLSPISVTAPVWER